MSIYASPRRTVESTITCALRLYKCNSRARWTIPSRSMDPVRSDSPARSFRSSEVSLEGKRRGGRRRLYRFRDTIRCYSYYDPYKGIFLFSRHIISARVLARRPDDDPLKTGRSSLRLSLNPANTLSPESFTLLSYPPRVSVISPYKAELIIATRAVASDFCLHTVDK